MSAGSVRRRTLRAGPVPRDDFSTSFRWAIITAAATSGSTSTRPWAIWLRRRVKVRIAADRSSSASSS